MAQSADDLKGAKIDLMEVEVAFTGQLVFACKAAGEMDLSGHDSVETCGVAFEIFIGERKIFELGFERVGLSVGAKVCFEGEGSVSCGQGEFLELEVRAFEGKGCPPEGSSEGSQNLG